ncbi:MAG TPA: hypothetical protein DCS19_13060, partial [Flavobacterium sp.]|nr:hypothetical protein [Flavobacterium sp.]
MKKTVEIRRNLKQRQHLVNLVSDLKKDLKETERIIERYEKTVEKLNYDLLLWDEFYNNLFNQQITSP